MRIWNGVRRVLILAAVGLAAITLHAGTFSAVQAGVCPEAFPPEYVCLGGSDIFAQYDFAPAAFSPLAVDFSLGVLNPPPFDDTAYFFGSASAVISTETMGIFVEAKLWDYGGGAFEPGIPAVSALSRVSDQITITGGTGYGYFLPQFMISGSIQSPQGNFIEGAVCLVAGTSSIDFACVPIESGQVSQTIQFNPNNLTNRFEFGVPFLWSVSFFGDIFVNDEFIEDPVTASMTLDFLSTLSFGSSLVVDEQGNPIRGLALSSSGGVFQLDGANLGEDGPPIPEPVPAMMAMIGFALMVWRHRNREMAL